MSREQAESTDIHDPIRVLYVDDDPGIGDVIKSYLEREDEQVTVKTAMGPEAGLAALEHGDIECIVSDYAMSPMNGLEFLDTVRESWPEIPFILYTAKGSEAVASEAISRGVTDYLQKGTGAEHYALLTNRIRNSVAQYRSDRKREAMQKRMEIALAETNSLIFEINLETGDVSRHGAVERFLGVDPSLVQTKTDYMEHVVHPEDHEVFREFFEGLQDGDREYDTIEYRTSPDLGPVRWLRGHAYLESPKRILGLVQDITEQKEREESLRHYKQSVESSKDLLAAVDENHRYLFANQEYRAYHDLEDIPITDHTLSEVLPTPQFNQIEPKVENALRGRPVQTEVTRTHPEKGDRVLDVRLFPLVGEGKEIRGVGASMRDITSEKQLQKDLKTSKERYESLFRSIRDAILVANTDREIINCNPAFTELFGYELSEIEGKPTKYLYENVAEYEALGRTLENQYDDPTVTKVVNYEKKSGQTFPGETNVFSLRNADHETVGFIGVIKDVSERRDRLKQLQMVDRVLQHNFHNDITVIQGFAEHLMDEGGPPLSTAAETIHETGANLLGTVKKERKITKFLSDPPSVEPLAIRTVCEEAVNRVTTAYPNAVVRTNYSGDRVVETTVAIETAVEELLTNSITHSTLTEPDVSLDVEATDEAVQIKIRDTNERIPAMERKVITGEAELGPLYHGSGMGLWLVSLIVKHSDGTLEFEKNHPVGNIVTIRLPLA